MAECPPPHLKDIPVLVWFIIIFKWFKRLGLIKVMETLELYADLTSYVIKLTTLRE